MLNQVIALPLHRIRPHQAPPRRRQSPEFARLEALIRRRRATTTVDVVAFMALATGIAGAIAALV